MRPLFQIRCTKCNEFMRYDNEVYQSTSFMEWTCWKCGIEITTHDLKSTIIEINFPKDGEE